MPKSAKGLSEAGADSPTTNDLLGVKRFAEGIAWKISNSSEKDTPFTYGVYGEWGSGKTSFLKMIDELLREQDIHPVWFNAWKYDQEDNLWSALIQTVLDQTRVSGKWHHRIWVKLKIWRDTFDWRAGSSEIVKGLLSIGLRAVIVGFGLIIIFGWSSSEISDFLNQVSPQWFSGNPAALTFFQASVIKTIVALITFFTTKPDEWLKLFDAKLGMDFSKLKRSKSYRAHIAFLDEFSQEFRQIIKLTGNGKPLVIIIDDLDRCLPEKAIQVLEAIKLFLDVEGCIFLLAVDRDVVEKAIAVKYKDLLAVTKDQQSKPEQLFTLLGENYFEKIVQLPFALPLISDNQFKNFVTNVYSDEGISTLYPAGRKMPRRARLYPDHSEKRGAPLRQHVQAHRAAPAPRPVAWPGHEPLLNPPRDETRRVLCLAGRVCYSYPHRSRHGAILPQLVLQ
jgi:Predicted P-loop ATPase